MQLPSLLNPSSTILPDDLYRPLLDSLRGRRCELIENPYGNAGDRLIQMGFLNLFDRNQIEIVKISKPGNGYRPHPKADTMLLYGGGSVGGFYTASPSLRRSMRNFKTIDKILLPQSAFDAEEDLSHFVLIFARERVSHEIMRSLGKCALVPDGALAMDPSSRLKGFQTLFTSSSRTDGVFLRSDSEAPGKYSGDWKSILDPSRESFERFILLPKKYGRIVTNRLHFALWSLFTRRSVILLPNSYHKNQSVHETWLSDRKITPFADLITFGEPNQHEK